MFIIDPHCHMVSRTTADYETMAIAGVVAISEPAFWAGPMTVLPPALSTTTANSPKPSQNVPPSLGFSIIRGSA